MARCNQRNIIACPFIFSIICIRQVIDRHQHVHAIVGDAGASDGVRRARGANPEPKPASAMSRALHASQDSGLRSTLLQETAAQNDMPRRAPRARARARIRGRVHGEAGRLGGGVRRRLQPPGASVRRVAFRDAVEADAHELALGEDLPGRAVHGVGRGWEMGGRPGTDPSQSSGHRSAENFLSISSHAECGTWVVAFHGGVLCGQAGARHVPGMACAFATDCAHGGAELGDVRFHFAVADFGAPVVEVSGDLCALG
jgi:hypothetical protein